MKSFLTGLSIGTALGILFAPRSGQESRGRIRDTAADVADSAREKVERGRDQLQKGLHAVRGATQSTETERREGEIVSPTGT
jgi:gas vesicle protein